MPITSKLKAVITSIVFAIVMIIKWIAAKFIYPIAYLAKAWIYGNDTIENYKMPEGVKGTYVKWFFWLFLDDDQPNGYPDRYAIERLGIIPETKWEKFKVAYMWSAWRNPAYNINYVYFGNQSPIVSHSVEFGEYDWNRKLRYSNGDNGAQFVWFTTEKGQSRFIFSVAKKYFGKIPFTAYFGWNPNFNGRFTVAGKFK